MIGNFTSKVQNIISKCWLSAVDNIILGFVVWSYTCKYSLKILNEAKLGNDNSDKRTVFNSPRVFCVGLPLDFVKNPARSRCICSG